MLKPILRYKNSICKRARSFQLVDIAILRRQKLLRLVKPACYFKPNIQKTFSSNQSYKQLAASYCMLSAHDTFDKLAITKKVFSKSVCCQLYFAIFALRQACCPNFFPGKPKAE